MSLRGKPETCGAAIILETTVFGYAAGTGCAAALDAERFITALDHEASTAGDAAATVEAIAEEVKNAGA